MVEKERGSGGGASGRAMAFCPSNPGSNPRTDLAFSEMPSIYSKWVSGYLLRMGHKTVLTLPSSFLFPII